MEDWFSRLLEMVEELRATTDVEVLSFSLCDPITASEVAVVEERLGAKLTDDIRDFFAISNGIQLKWIHKKNREYDSVKHKPGNSRFDWLAPLDRYGREDGCINLLPLDVAIVEQEWGDIVWSYEDEGQTVQFAGETRDLLELMKQIKPIDLFSKSSCMSLLTEHTAKNPMMLLTQDHFADVESSRLTDFRSYLEFLLHHWGLVEARTAVYSEYGGHEQPPIVTTRDYWADRSRPDLCRLYA